MKKIFAISIIFLICTIGKTVTDSNNTIVPDFNNTAVPDTNTTADCLEKIKQLERVIESQEKRLAKTTDAFNNLKKQLDEQIKENEKLKALLPKDKINSVVPAASFDSNDGIVYHGKKRDRLWFYRMYKEFQNKIAFVDGKYIYIKNKAIDSIPKELVPEGTLIKNPSGKVLQVLRPGEAIIWQKGTSISFSPIGGGAAPDDLWHRIATSVASTPDIFYHVKGYKDKLVDDQSFSYNGCLVSAGTFEYTDISGAKRTIQSFAVYEPLTREQFADAINSGFILTKQSKVGDKTIEQPIL